MRSRSSRSRARRAVAAVEFAFLAPVLITLLFGVWEVARMIQMYQIVSNASREGARQAATGKYHSSQDNPQIQQTILSYLISAQVPAHDTIPNGQVTLANTNCTFNVQGRASGSDVADANQLDPITVTVTVPVKNFRWTSANWYSTDATTISSTASFLCLRDVPLQVDTGIPGAPLP
jgi:Flp pilus assembly protein TadG